MILIAIMHEDADNYYNRVLYMFESVCVCACGTLS